MSRSDVLDVAPGPPVFQTLAPMLVGDQVEDLHAGLRQFDDAVGCGGGQVHAHGHDHCWVGGLDLGSRVGRVGAIHHLRHAHAGQQVVVALDIVSAHDGHDEGKQFGCQLGGLGRRHDGHGVQLLGRRGSGGGQVFALQWPAGHVQDGRQLKLQQLGRRGEHPALGREAQAHGLGADVHGGGDVLAAVDAVAGGADDLRHVRPDGIEARAVEAPAIAGSGHGDLAGVGLVPAGEDDVGRPVVVAHVQEPRVDGNAQKALGAALHAGKAGLALIEGLDGGLRVAVVGRLVPVGIVETAQFDAVGAAGAVLAPVDVAELAHPMEARGYRSDMDVVAVGHTGLPYASLAAAITSPARASEPPLRMWMPRTPGMVLSAAAISTAMARPALAGSEAWANMAITDSSSCP